MKFGLLKNIREIFFFKHNTEHEAESLVPDLKTLYKVKANGLQFSFNKY